MDIKSTFKKDKIVNGELKEKSKNIYISKKFINGKMDMVTADILSRREYKRLTIKIVNKNIVFSYLKDSVSKIEVALQND